MGWERWRVAAIIGAIVGLSLLLNLSGNRWGLPRSWHPDSLVGAAIDMVDHRRVDVDSYQYGALPYYTIATLAAAPVYYLEPKVSGPRPDPRDDRATEQWIERRTAHVLWVSRWLAALLATATVVITIRLGQALFDLTTGLLAGLLTAVSMALVAVAHFDTVDSHATFWYWLACLTALSVWRRGGWAPWVLAGVVGGVAAGVKFDRIVIMAPLVVALATQPRAIDRGGPRRRAAQILALPVLMLAGFALANPVLALRPFKYLDGFTRDLFLNALRGSPAEWPYSSLLWGLTVGLGWPLLALSLGGAAWMIRQTWTGPERRESAYVLSTWLVYAVLLCARHMLLWYAPILVPGLMLGAARLVTRWAKHDRVAAWGIAAVVVAFSLGYCGLMDYQFARNSRALATEWVKVHVPAGATIALGRKGPYLPEGRYVVTQVPGDAGAWEFALRWRQRLESDRTYGRVRSAILGAERWASDHLGLRRRPAPYRAWFDRVAEGVPPGPSGPPDADFVVLVRAYHPTLTTMLESPGSGYEVLAGFGWLLDERKNQWRWWHGLWPHFSFVDTPVTVYGRTARAR
jgi:hypothetical protein